MTDYDDNMKNPRNAYCYYVVVTAQFVITLPKADILPARIHVILSNHSD